MKFPKILLVAPLWWAVPAGAQTILSDAENTTGWSKGATIITNAKEGQRAVRFVLLAGAAGPALNINHLGDKAPDFSKGGELSFWYRFSGAGSSNLMIKIVAAPLANGMQAVWDIAPQLEADGKWHRAVVDLGTQFMTWGEKPDLANKIIMFRTDATTDKVMFDVDQVTFGPALFAATIKSSKLANLALRSQVELKNRTNAPLTLDVAGQKVILAANETKLHEIAQPLNAAELANAKPLTTITQPLRITVADQPDMEKQIEARFTTPLNLPPTPRLLLTDAEVPVIKARIAAQPQLKARYEALLKEADGFTSLSTDLPPRGGQWYHYYACKKDGGRLNAISPTQHKCEICGEIYSGWPYDDVYLATLHDRNARAIKSLGLAYRLSGDKKYARKTRDLLMAYADKYNSYPLHDIKGNPNVGGGKIGPQTLDESTWTIQAVQGADLIWDTLSAAEQKHIGDDLFRPAAQVIRQHKMGIHNIQCWKNSAVGLVGLLVNDAELVADAINSPNGFKKQIEKGISADGQWYEGAWGYHFYTMNAIVPLAEAGARTGLNIYEYVAPNGRSFKSLFDGPVNFAMPNLLLPAFNDSGTVNVAGQQGLYELAFARYGDARFAEVLRVGKRDALEALLLGAKELPPVQNTQTLSKNYPATGYSILQNSAGPNATWLCLKYGPHGGGHGHPDKLNFVLYSRSHILGVDPGTARYGIPIQDEWYKTTLAHNTLTVDETNQASTEGKSLAFLSQPGVSAALAEAGSIYPGVTYRRAVALLGDNTILVLDMAKSENEHSFDFAYHHAGKWAQNLSGTAINLPGKNGYKHFQGATKINGALPMIQTGDNTQTHITVASIQHGETIAGTGVGNNATDRVPMIVQRVRGKEAAVAWLISLNGTGKVNVSQNGNAWTAQAEVGGKTYRVTAAPDAQEKLKVE